MPRIRVKICCISSGGEARMAPPAGVDICPGLRHNGKLDSARLGTFVAAVRGEPMPAEGTSA